ncbi:MAG: patatin-like phospholipase family protein [Bryobacteraceae bacterium]
MITSDRLPYFVVYVKDRHRARNFITENLGLRVRDLQIPDDSDFRGRAIALAFYGTTLLIVEESPDSIPGVETGRGYPSFEVEDLESFHQHTKRQKVECVQEPRPDGVGKIAAYRDPDGLILLAVQPKKKAESHGIVFSGGGAYGAFELGVLRRLAAKAGGSYAGLNRTMPSVLTGTSVGAFNAAWLACALGGPPRPLTETVESLVDVWRKRIAGGLSNNGAYRIRGNVLGFPRPSELLDDTAFLARDLVKRLIYAGAPPPEISRILRAPDLSAVISTQPLRDLVDTLHWRRLEKSPCRLQVAATDWVQGQLRLFGHNPPGTELLKIEEPMNESNFRDVVMASTAIPGFFAPVEVETISGNGGREKRICVDGGLVLNSPLNPAIDAGATDIHLICLNPDVSTLDLSPINSTLDTMKRSLATAVAAGVASELARVDLGNRLAGVVRHKNSDDFYREVTVHRYHPSKDVLGGVPGILDFSLTHLDKLIEDGERNVQHHDCDKAKCIRPGNHLELHRRHS